MTSSSSFSTHEKWVPEQTKDCSLGLCSVYCPQWCYLLLPPPPPPPSPPRPHLDLLLPINPSSSSSSSSFSPLVVAIIGVLASAVLLLAYYALVSDRCGAAALLRRLLLPHPPPPPLAPASPSASAEAEAEAEAEAWSAAAPASSGIDETLISRIMVCSYKKGGGEGWEQCSVCLSEFQEEERLRLLPTCGHAFHVQCIDAWLKSHSNCPLCRSTIVFPKERVGEEEGGDAVVVVVEAAEEELEFVGEEEEEEEEEDDEEVAHAGNSNGEGYHHLKLEYGTRSTTRPETQHRGAVSIADVLRMSMGDEISAAKEDGLLQGTGISSSGGGIGRE